MRQQSIGYMVRWLLVYWLLTVASFVLILTTPSNTAKFLAGAATILLLGVSVVVTLAVLKIKRDRSR